MTTIAVCLACGSYAPTEDDLDQGCSEYSKEFEFGDCVISAGYVVAMQGEDRSVHAARELGGTPEEWRK